MRITLATIPTERLRLLNLGAAETAHLTEWLAVDMAQLLKVVRRELQIRHALPRAIAQPEFRNLGITRRLAAIGGYLVSAGCGPDDKRYRLLLSHRSDVVRQWTGYILLATHDLPLRRRLIETRLLAADSNMSVREVAWMTFRPYLAMKLMPTLHLLEPWTADDDPKIRRFAIEVSRPRSVWGRHIVELKQSPEHARPLLENVRQDPSKYVQDAAGNWLNDASKSAADWVVARAQEWLRLGASRETRRILRRGLRSIKTAHAAARYVHAQL